MKTVALLSGGKDSCFNLCHCVAQGHEVVALASLGPDGGKEEIDSYLYQTVGQDGLHFIAQAIELPLFRRTIMGTAVDQAADYAASSSAARLKGAVEGDETEDLYLLLQDVLAAHPDVKGVSVGAILSNYQRVRVEHVCARLGLQSLAYLWQYDQSQLLEDMHAAGMECIIIKVAGAGLGVRHLGQNVCGDEMRETLAMLNAKWGTHPAGEGGEYETFTIDCPLFKKRINLTHTEAVLLSSGDSRDDIGTVAYLRLKGAELVPKPEGAGQLTAGQIPMPDLLDAEAERIARALQAGDTACRVGKEHNSAALRVEDGAETAEEQDEPSHTNASGDWVAVGRVACRAESLEDEVRACFKMLQDRLAVHGLDLTSVAHINLYLSSMSLFPSVNAVYNTFFGPSPPTRACVSVLLPPGQRMRMDVLAHKASSRFQPGTLQNQRSALHVRGLSYWAPANIGPYSQAMRAGERLLVAGQIGLRPSDLTLVSSADSLSASGPASEYQRARAFGLEAALAAQHARRIVRAVQEGTGGGFTGWMESCICWVSGPPHTFAAKRDAARTAWSMWLGGAAERSLRKGGVPFLVVQTPELPRDARVEWQITWQTGRRPLRHLSAEEQEEHNDDNDDEDLRPVPASISDDSGLLQQSLQTGRSAATFVTVPLASSVIRGRKAATPFSLRAFYTAGTSLDQVRQAATSIYGDEGVPYTAIEVLNLATAAQDQLAIGFCGFSEATQ